MRYEKHSKNFVSLTFLLIIEIKIFILSEIWSLVLGNAPYDSLSSLQKADEWKNKMLVEVLSLRLMYSKNTNWEKWL